MKQKNKKPPLIALVDLVKKNHKTSLEVKDVSLIPFVLSFFNQRKFLSVPSVLFDDLVGSFVLNDKGFYAVPFVENSNKKESVFDVFSYYQFLFNQAYYSSFSSFDVCVYDSLVFDLEIFKKKQGSFLKISDSLVSFDDFLFYLEQNGYVRVEEVFSPGDYVVRGGVVDCFSFGGKCPFRVSFFDEKVLLYIINIEGGEIISSIKEVFVFPFDDRVGSSLSSFVKKDDLLVSYDGNFLSFTNSSVSFGDVLCDKKLCFLDFEKYKKLNLSQSGVYSKLLLTNGFLCDDIAFLPFWFKNKDFGVKKRVGEDFFDLVVGNYYIHEFFGVCCFLGLEETSSLSFDRVCLRFSDGVLKMDVQYLYRLSFFAENGRLDVSLDFLNKSSGWKRKKSSAVKKAEEYVEHLVLSYGKRNSIEREPCVYDSSLFSFFMSSFKYQDTGDQLSSWEEVKSDLCSPFPMNRLLCGDVGFGKTEVALRAIFLCVMNNKKVVLVAPTTILSKQLFFLL